MKKNSEFPGNFIDLISSMAQLAGGVEYANCISTEGSDSSNECLDYDTKLPFATFHY